MRQSLAGIQYILVRIEKSSKEDKGFVSAKTNAVFTFLMEDAMKFTTQASAEQFMSELSPEINERYPECELAVAKITVMTTYELGEKYDAS